MYVFICPDKLALRASKLWAQQKLTRILDIVASLNDILWHHVSPEYVIFWRCGYAILNWRFIATSQSVFVW